MRSEIFNKVFFTATTADDQTNYYSNNMGANIAPPEDESSALPAGNYRMIDGNLCQILVSVDFEDFRKKLKLNPEINE